MGVPLMKGLIIFLIIFSNASAQKLSDAASIRTYSDSINNLFRSKTIHLGSETLSTFEGFVEGDFFDDSLLKVSHVIAHVSVYQEDYYFKDGTLVLLRRTRNHYKSKEYENFYYFRGNKLFLVECFPKKKSHKKKLQKEILEVAYRYRKLCLEKGSKNNH